ncbi:uncharacterized protein LOC143287682 isoform X2 [Babylonia areolata]
MDPTVRAVLNDFGLVQHTLLESAEHTFVHVIHSHCSRDFVHTELTEELKSCCGLQLVPTHRLVDLASVKPVTDIIVILDKSKNIFLHDTVKTYFQPDTHVLFLQTGDYRPSWIDRCFPHHTLMLYSVSQKNLSHFWHSLASLIGRPNMDPTVRAVLNDFGPVQHTLLESAEHTFVHVIHSHYSRDFVHTELTDELKSRCGLQLVPTHRLVDLPSVKPVTDIIVILNNPANDMFLQNTVYTYCQPDTHILFLQKGDYRLSWIVRCFLHHTLMLYSVSQKNLSHFWHSLASQIGRPNMDPTVRAVLNDFGLVQHTFLESAEHTFVHVIHSHCSRDFVHTELTEELKSRCGLQLVPTHRLLDLPSVKPVTDIIVILDNPDNKMFLQDTVTTYCQPDTHILFLQTGDYRPFWIYKSFRQHSHMLCSVSQKNLSHFWHSLASLIGRPNMDPTVHAVLNDFGPVQHTFLESAEHMFVHVIHSHCSRDFVHTELTEELKSRCGLQLVPRHRLVDLASIIPVTDIIAILDKPDNDMFLQDTVTTYCQPDTHILFLQKGHYRPSWIDRCFLHHTLMLYSVSQKNLSHFWHSLASEIGRPNMDSTVRAALNDFGPVQHTLLESAEHTFVHVIHSRCSRDVVYTELTEELKSRCGLQLVPTHRLVDLPSVKPVTDIIVILDNPHKDIFLQNTVYTCFKPDTHILFLHKGDCRLFWIVRCFLHHTLMLYSVSQKNLSHFWHSLASQIGRPNMDPTVRAVLNDFGPVQHTLLESAEHTFVHVIHSRCSRDFVHTELTDELKSRCGLQLVPTHRLVDLPSVKPVTDIIVILDNPDNDMFLQDTVYACFKPDTHILFLQKAKYHPSWIDARIPPCNLMLYPESQKKTLSEFWHRLASRIEKHKLSTLTEMVGSTGSQQHEQTSSTGSCSKETEQSTDQHSTVESGDIMDAESVNTNLGNSNTGCFEDVKHVHKTEEQQPADLQTTSGMQTVIQGVESDVGSQESDDSISCHNDGDESCRSHCSYCSTTSSASSLSDFEQSDTEEQQPADLQTTSGMQTLIQGVESDVGSQESDDSISCHNDGDESCRSHCSYCSTTSPASSLSNFEQSDYSDENSGEVNIGGKCHASDAYRSENTVPPPIFVEDWQTSIVLNKEGGCLKQDNSDVVLRVPADAVEDNPVEVHAAVCANVDHIRDVLKLSDDEEVISPVAEYWAGEIFHFQRPVTVELPHILPSDCDPELVYVYHVSRNQHGKVCVSRLKHEKDDDTPGGVTLPHDQIISQDKVTLSPANEETVQNVESEAAASTGEPNSHDGMIERLGNFKILPEGIVTISTCRFCGYVCVKCNAKKKKNPPLYVMGCVRDSSERWIEISSCVWDARLKISDFRKEYGVEPGNDKKYLNRLENLTDSKLYMRLRLSEGFSHCLDVQGNPLLPELKKYDIPSMLSCKKCITRGKFFPISNDWILEPRNGYVLSPDHVFVVDVTHVAANVSPSWQDVDQREKLTTVVVKMPESQWTKELQALSTAELESMAKNLNISEPRGTESRRDQFIQRLTREGPVKVLLHLVSQVSHSHNSRVPDVSSPRTTSPQMPQGSESPSVIGGSDETEPDLHETQRKRIHTTSPQMPQGPASPNVDGGSDETEPDLEETQRNGIHTTSAQMPQMSGLTISVNRGSADETEPDCHETQMKRTHCSGSQNIPYGIQETLNELPRPVFQESIHFSMPTSVTSEPKTDFSYSKRNEERDGPHEAQCILDSAPRLSHASSSSFLRNYERSGTPHELNSIGNMSSTQAWTRRQQADGLPSRSLRYSKETVQGGDGMEDYFAEMGK